MDLPGKPCPQPPGEAAPGISVAAAVGRSGDSSEASSRHIFGYFRPFSTSNFFKKSVICLFVRNSEVQTYCGHFECLDRKTAS